MNVYIFLGPIIGYYTNFLQHFCGISLQQPAEILSEFLAVLTAGVIFGAGKRKVFEDLVEQGKAVPLLLAAH